MSEEKQIHIAELEFDLYQCFVCIERLRDRVPDIPDPKLDQFIVDLKSQIAALKSGTKWK